MQANTAKIAAALAGLSLLAACGGEPRLMPFSGKEGPDEFAVLPTKPLETPENYTDLPVPTPGAMNLVDPTPNADAVVALGGSASALNRQGADGGIVNYANRYGTNPNIRAELAEDDLKYRKRNNGRLLDRLFGRNSYLKAYRRQSLDPYSEQDRLRRAGVLTPTSPPKGVQSE